MKSRVIFAISLALLLCCYFEFFVVIRTNRQYPARLGSSFFPLGVCCYITLFISGFLIPQPAHHSRAPLVVFWAAFATLVFCLLCPLVEMQLRKLQTDLLAAVGIDSFNTNSQHVYRSPLMLQMTFAAVVAPVCHLAMLAAATHCGKAVVLSLTFDDRGHCDRRQSSLVHPHSSRRSQNGRRKSHGVVISLLLFLCAPRPIYAAFRGCPACPSTPRA